MEASKVSFTASTRLRLKEPGLSVAKRRELKTESIKALIRSKPAGTPISWADLIYAAGYPVKKKSAGYAFVKGLVAKKVIVRVDPLSTKYKQAYLVPEDAKTFQEEIKSYAKDITGSSSHSPEFTQRETVYNPETHRDERVIPSVETLSIGIVQKAKQWAWDNNSDSLRAFIASLQ